MGLEPLKGLLWSGAVHMLGLAVRWGWRVSGYALLAGLAALVLYTTYLVTRTVWRIMSFKHTPDRWGRRPALRPPPWRAWHRHRRAAHRRPPCRPLAAGNESHAGQVFTCIGALALAGALERADRDLFAWWLAERQTPSGGLNGRPEKLQDVCYSWWCLSCLAILGRLHWIDTPALRRFILHCQDEQDGGISDRPEDMADVYHTFFGIAGLALTGQPGLRRIDPAYALPEEVVQRLKRRQAEQQQQQRQRQGGV